MSKERFRKKLAEQTQLLAASCKSYDEGVEIEGFRIALALRVLFHQTTQSTSLFTHLGIKNCLMLATVPNHANFTAFIQIQLALASPQPVRALPKRGNSFHPLPLTQWWSKQIVYAFQTAHFTRKQVILAAANKDGGGHVDAKLDDFYEALSSGSQTLAMDGSKLQYTGKAPYDQSRLQYCQNLHLAMIRQFGHEVLASSAHFKWL